MAGSEAARATTARKRDQRRTEGAMWCRETMGMFGEARPRFLYLSLSSPPPLSLPPSLSLLQTAIASFLPALTPPPPSRARGSRCPTCESAFHHTQMPCVPAMLRRSLFISLPGGGPSRVQHRRCRRRCRRCRRRCPSRPDDMEKGRNGAGGLPGRRRGNTTHARHARRLFGGCVCVGGA